MRKHILITGGAGFIGSHLSDEFLRRGYKVRILDSLSPNVHGPDQRRPDYLHNEVELIVGDVCDPDAVRTSLEGIDTVFHLAAAVGVGESMYEVVRYNKTNNLGTAVLLESLINRPVERLIVASSMSIYGEGLYRAPDGSVSAGVERTLKQLKAKDWEVRNADGEVLTPIPTPELKPPSLASVYALSKYDQERMCLIVGRAYGIATVALRFFNVYGTRQALSNPYTGVLSIFASRLLNGNPPLVFEDGHQRRDFVNVHDVAQACCLALESTEAIGQVFNVGGGCSYTILDISVRMANLLGKRDIQPEITESYRAGDIRHCFADTTAIHRVLGYKPRVTFEEGLTELAAWLDGQTANDRIAEARAELDRRGLIL